MRYKIGDWIRFQHGGVLVIGSIVYIRPRSKYDSTLVPVTAEYGPVSEDSILEVRGGPAPQE